MLSFKDIAKIFEEIELMLIKSLKRNLSAHKKWEKAEGFQWSAWQTEKLRNIENFRKQNRELVSHYASVIDNTTHQLMEEQFKEGEELVNAQLNEIRKTNPEANRTDIVTSQNFFGVNSQRMEKLINDITTLEKDALTSALRTTDDVYRQTLNKVQLAMGTGSMTLNQAIDSAVNDFLQKGINSITYKNGRRVNIADYVRMALRTTATRSALQGQSKRAKELGYDTVLISQYDMCSDTCLPYQGRVYIDDVFTVWEGERNGETGKSNYCKKWFPLLSSAIKGGLFHPNCRHTMTLWIDGRTKLPKPIDSKKDLERYRLEQKQRAMEREVRKCKRLVEGSSDPDNIKKYKKQLREAQSSLKKFVDSHSDFLRRDYSREKVYNSVQNNLTSKNDNGIIKSEIYDSIRDFIGTDNISDEKAKSIDEVLSVVPKAILNRLESYVSKIAFEKGRGYSSYSQRTRAIILDKENAEKTILHELGHAFGDMESLYNNDEFLSIISDNLNLEDWSEVIPYLHPDKKDEYVYILNSPKFITPYQGRIYANISEIDWSQPINAKLLKEYISVGFDTFFTNPELLKEKDIRLFEFLEARLNE